jgi:hypothetical protein
MADVKPKAAKKAGKAQETQGLDNAEVQKPEKDPQTGRFVTGNIGGGRNKGARNKLGEAFLQAMLKDFTEHGEDVIVKVREEKPDVYLKTVASILPQQLNVKVEPFEDMTDDQLRKHAERLLAELGPVAAFASGRDTERAETAPAGKPLN